MQSVEVQILGQQYTLKGEASKEHLEKLSGYIEESIKRVCDTYPNITPTKALILTIFSMADELFKLKLEQDEITHHLERKAAMLSGLLD
jgi:cell division protein ZapA